MKTLFSIFIAATLLGVCISTAESREPVSLEFFYDNLDDQGTWREVGDYGYCWQPYDIDQNWRPYSDGRWVYTDAGWTWDSDEPYGWAVYHYGRWTNVQGLGWVWVPGTEWGPGWVSWRHSDRYVGWAPLPPEARFVANIGFSAWVDDYYDIGPRNYCFVESRNFGSHHQRSHYVDQRENITIIHQTTNITNITYQNNVIYNGGLGFEDMQRQSSDPIRRYSLDRREDFDGDPRHLAAERLRSRVDGSSLSVFAPSVAAPSIAARSLPAPRKHSEKLDRAEINHGWTNAGSADEVAATRTKMKSQVKAPDALPPKPKFDQTIERAPGVSPRIQDRPPTPREQVPQGKSRQPGIPADPKRLPSEPETKPRMVEPQRQPSDAPKHENKKPSSPTSSDPTNQLKREAPKINNVPQRPRTNDTPPKAQPQPPVKRNEPQEPRNEPRPGQPMQKPQEPRKEPKHEAPKQTQEKQSPKRPEADKPAPQSQPEKGNGKSEDKRKKKDEKDAK